MSYFLNVSETKGLKKGKDLIQIQKFSHKRIIKLAWLLKLNFDVF